MELPYSSTSLLTGGNDAFRQGLQRARQQLLQRANAGEIKRPKTDDELHAVVLEYCGLDIPRKQVCPGHSSPFQAFADAYFARFPITVWKASRGFGGKSVLLAILGYIEIITLDTWVNLLGGSGEQSKRVHEYMQGDHPRMPDKFWASPNAPRHILRSDPIQRETKLVGGGNIKVLMASQTSVRGPHPTRLRLDEADETTIQIMDAALGQPMSTPSVKEQTVLSSTHHNPNGTMTEILRRAGQNGWPVYEWCWKETLKGWLSPEMVESKRATVTAKMWEIEYDLQEPSHEGRAIDPDSVEAMFRTELGVFEGDPKEYIEIESPVRGATYATGADWAKEQDMTVIITLRTDVDPYRLVAYERMNKMPWPYMVGRYNKRLHRFQGEGVHDGTGVGNVVDDYLEGESEAFLFVGRKRQDLLTEYIHGIENGEIESPRIEGLYSVHKYATSEVIYGSGHLPDDIAAAACAYRAANRSLGILV